MIYYSDQQACIIYLRNRKMAYLAAEGFVNSNALQNFMKKFLELSSKQNIEAIIVDASRLEILKTQDIDWINNIIYPKLKPKPIQKISFIKPQNIFGDVSLNRLIPQETQKEFRKFNTIEDAESWIFQNDQSIG